MKELFHNIRAGPVIERVKTDNVLNPLLWVCGITVTAAVPAAFFSQGNAQIFFGALAAVPIIASLVAYFIWMFKDPDRLQSEDYQIKRQVIRQGSKEHGVILDTSRSIEHPPRQIEEAEILKPDAPAHLLVDMDGQSRKNGA